jgi:hypothetical protein
MEAGNNTVFCRGKLWTARETADGKRCYLVRADWPANRGRRRSSNSRNSSNTQSSTASSATSSRRSSANSARTWPLPARGRRKSGTPIDPALEEIYPGLYE